MNKKIFIIFALIVLSYINILAQNPDPNILQIPQEVSDVSGKYLDIGVGAAGAGMGNAYQAVAKDASSIFWNPAGLANMKRDDDDWSLFFAHDMWMADMSDDHISIAKNTKPFGVFGLGISYYNEGSIQKYGIDSALNPVDMGSSFSPYAFVGSISYSNSMDKDIDFGVNLKYIYDNIDNDDLQTMAFDIGVRYFSPMPGLQFNIVAQNFGGRFDDFILAKQLSFDTLYNFSLENFKLNLDADVCGEVSANPVFRFGLEVVTPYIIVLRAGYQTDNTDVTTGIRNITLGFGLNVNKNTVDFAWEPYGDLGNVFKISLACGF